MNEIIGINTAVKEEGAKPTGKTSIMTTSTGKTLKRKHDDDIVKIDSDEVCIIADNVSEKKSVAEPTSEITITAIPKATAAEKSNGNEPESPVA